MMAQSLCRQTSFAIQTATIGLFIEVALQDFYGTTAQRQTAGIEVGEYVLFCFIFIDNLCNVIYTALHTG